MIRTNLLRTFKTSPRQNVSIQNVYMYSSQNVSVTKRLHNKVSPVTKRRLTLYLRKFIFSYPFKPSEIPLLVIICNVKFQQGHFFATGDVMSQRRFLAETFYDRRRFVVRRFVRRRFVCAPKVP
jgi:hypothetical protein